MPMLLCVKGLCSGYDQEHLARVFFPKAKPCKNKMQTRGEALVYARSGKRHLAVALRKDGQVVWRRISCEGMPEAEKKMALSRLLYGLLCKETGQRPPWGMLTGVRPVRLLRKKEQALSHGEALRFLQAEYDVSAKKQALAARVLQAQKPFLQNMDARDASLYISIPFCPTRCSYCSFVSQSVEKEGALLAPYLEKLETELWQVAALMTRCKVRLRSVYVGGGTPSVLSAKELARLLSVVRDAFDLSHLLEYTVEVGRPDCTDFEKLTTIKEFGVTRVSVNPQSMTPGVLQAIGRNHTAEDILRCVREVRAVGFSALNMDIIAGLPQETPQSFAESFQKTIACAPENLTVHSLTLKRASRLAEAQGHTGAPEEMLEVAYAQLEAAGYHPYYLYRQKNTPGNFENTGWTKPGFEGVYNIYIMEEVQTIFSVGAGGVSKLVFGQGAHIRRFFNDKIPLAYLRDFEKVSEKNREMESVYAGFLDTETSCGSGACECGGRDGGKLCSPL